MTSTSKSRKLLPTKMPKKASYSFCSAVYRALKDHTSSPPSLFLRFSVKFGRKVQYVNYLHELQQHMELDQLPIPNQVKE